MQIAVLKETAGKGTFCSLIMAVVVVKDILVFCCFAINLELSTVVHMSVPSVASVPNAAASGRCSNIKNANPLLTEDSERRAWLLPVITDTNSIGKDFAQVRSQPLAYKILWTRCRFSTGAADGREGRCCTQPPAAASVAASGVADAGHGRRRLAGLRAAGPRHQCAARPHHAGGRHQACIWVELLILQDRPYNILAWHRRSLNATILSTHARSCTSGECKEALRTQVSLS